MSEKVGRGEVNLWIDKLTPEEKKAHYEKMQQARVDAKIRRLENQRELEEKAKDLLPEIVAQKMLEEALDENWEPTQDMIDRIKLLTDKGYTIEEMRAGFFKTIDQKVWDKIIRGLFKTHVPMIESLGLDLITSRKKAIRILKRRAKMVRKEMKEYKKGGKMIPVQLFNVLGQIEDRLHDVEVELAQVLNRIGVVGSKAKSSSISIHLHTPRPKPVEAIDVTPSK